jgi:hypothetical protein
MGAATYLWRILWLRWSIRLLPILWSTVPVLGLAPVTLLVGHGRVGASESRQLKVQSQPAMVRKDRTETRYCINDRELQRYEPVVDGLYENELSVDGGDNVGKKRST